MNHKFLVFAASVMASVVPLSTITAQTYKNPKAPVEARVSDLLSRMTLHEKVEQLSMAGLGDVINGSVVGVCESPFIDMKDIAPLSASAKKQAREHSRLGIPPIQIAECLHGVLAYGATIFPQAIAQGSTWNPDLIEQMGSAIADEANTMGVDMALSPLFDLIRDPRYGRNEECFSEDALLTGTLGSAFIKGMQGTTDAAGYMQKNKVMCTAKHFAAYSIPRAGINLGPASVGERELRSTFLPPFEMAVKGANVCAVMPSYNEIDGVPAHSNRFLLTDVLRKEWGFKGLVISDYGGLSHLYNFHNVARDKSEAALMGIHAGVDVEAARPDVYPSLEQLVNDGRLSEAVVDSAVARVLRAKFMAGLFEKPYANAKNIKKRVHTPEHQQLAKQIAEESVILLKNDKGILPLDLSKLKSIAVVGPNADQVEYGDYCYTRDNSSGITVLNGIKKLAGDSITVNYAKGCSLSGLSKDGFGEAVSAAQKSDVVVAVMGETSVILSGLGWGKGPGESEIGDPFTSGEGYDVTDINPTGVQRDLLKELVKTGKPVVLVIVNGRPWSIDWEKEHMNAILQAWYPGEKGGEAIAEILTGAVNPSGRLNATFPQSVGHLPVTYDYKPSAHGINRKPGTPEKAGMDYVFSSPDPLFPFGYGLSYTTFNYSDLQISKKQFGNETIQVSATITNTGKREGKEVVQLYVRDLVSSVTTPVKVLKGFKKIDLKPGESKRVTFDLSYKDLALWNSDMKLVTEPGDFEVMIGSSAEDVKLKDTVSYNL